MKLVGPKGWDCRAFLAADGSGDVIVHPTGESLGPVDGSWTAQELAAARAEPGITGSQTSACVSCRLGQACPLFASAARDFESYLGRPCPTRPAAKETIDPLSPGVVAFQDPPGVAGTSPFSGGPYPADGVMTYHSGDDNGSWVDICTLPASQHAVCTAALNAFLAAYGTL